MPDNRSKKARGNYAKLICLQCRERRIKCLLPDDVTIIASREPQPPASSCRRCTQKGVDCIVRRTTLGRPNRKDREPISPAPTSNNDRQSSLSPSPYVEDYVICNPDDQQDGSIRSADSASERSYAINGQPKGAQLAEAIDKTLDRTLNLLGRDRQFGSAISNLDACQPSPILDIVNEELAATLQTYLLWHRTYLPHLPSLVKLHHFISQSGEDEDVILSATVVLALLCTVALDAPVQSLASVRHVQSALRIIIYHAGRQMLFALPRHDYTLIALEVINQYRPLSLLGGQEAATHALNGKLYTTLGKTMAHQLNLHHAPGRLRHLLDGLGPGDGRGLVFDSLRWTWWMMSDFSFQGDVRSSNPLVHEPEAALEFALQAVSDAFDAGIGPPEALMAFHSLRYEADNSYYLRCLTRDWQNLDKLRAHITDHNNSHARRQIHFEQGLNDLFLSKGQATESVAFTQLSNMQLNISRTNILGVAMFFAIVSEAQKISSSDKRHRQPPVQLNRYFRHCVSQHVPWVDGTPISDFLDEFGDVQLDALEKRVADFISVASEVSLQGIPFMAPPRQMSCNIVFACKEIVENNAVRLKMGQELHHRVDVQLILFMEAARRLEAMEADGGTTEAMARGSIFAACAKLIRSLHRIILQWKRNFVNKIEPSDEHRKLDGVVVPVESQITPPIDRAMDIDSIFTDNFFADWDNWQQQLDSTGMSDPLGDQIIPHLC